MNAWSYDEVTGWSYDFEADLRGLRALIGAHLRPGFTFVNIGANDGVQGDPIWPFATSLGWRGVCVEPVPATCALLRANYSPHPGVQIVQAAISRERRGRFWYIDDADYVTSQIGSLDRDRVQSSLDSLALMPEIEVHVPSEQPPIAPIDTTRRDGTLASVEIEGLTFDDLAERCDLDRVDLVNIDVEGTDWEVLEMIDLDRFQTSVVIVETGGTPGEAEIRDHLTDHGFGLRRRFGAWSTVWERAPRR